MTKEAKNLRDAFYEEARRASDAIDVALAAPIARQVQQPPGGHGAVVDMARDIREVAGLARARIECMLNGRSMREVRS